MGYQKIILVGNATSEAKVEKPEGKLAYADLTVAVKRTQERVDLFPVRCFGNLAETVAGTKKGDRLLVEGKVENTRFVLNRESQSWVTIRVVAGAIRFF
jgi:single-stranded DNA-binding protein